MLVENFTSECGKFENFQIWDVENMQSFFKGNEILPQIFKDNYKQSVDDFLNNRDSIANSDLDIVENLLSQIGDKHFVVFTLHSKNHMELIMLQHKKIMHFGINIEQLNGDHLYIMIMDKKKTYANA